MAAASPAAGGRVLTDQPAGVRRPPGREGHDLDGDPGVDGEPQGLGPRVAAHHEPDPLHAERLEREDRRPGRGATAEQGGGAVVLDVGQRRLDAPDVGVVGVPAHRRGAAPAC